MEQVYIGLEENSLNCDFKKENIATLSQYAWYYDI